MKNLKNITVLLFLLLIAAISCKHDNSIKIHGDIKGLDAKWIYLYPTYPVNNKPIDSVQIVNDQFDFNIHPDTPFVADLVSVRYGENRLGIINPNKKEQSLYADFIMEPGLTTLTGDFSKNKRITLKGGPQNDFYFKNIQVPFIRISKDNIKADAQANHLKRLVQETPNAYWAMLALGNLKYSFTHQQLQSVYNEFSDDIKSSYKGKEISQFIKDQPTTKIEFENNVFMDTDAKFINLIDTTKKLNMVIFWASWCGPCRTEIPSLKRIAAVFKGSDIRLVSISIDVNKDNWLKAVEQENMPWQQLIIPAHVFSKANAQYNLGLVPQIYLVNNKNRVVKKTDGFYHSSEEDIKTFIAGYLAKN